MNEPKIVDRAEIAPPAHLERSWFSAGGRVIDDFAAVFGVFGLGPGDVPPDALPEILNVGVNEPDVGVIQDPAGSAVGTGRRPRGDGASGQIYARFPDLKPIPAMREGAAVFNGTTSAGRRVLHTYSPSLTGNPEDDGARGWALGALIDAYANALLAVAERVGVLGPEGAVCNLVPVSGSIYAHSFKRGRFFETAHLDPSYTLVAITVAIAYVRADGAR